MLETLVYVLIAAHAALWASAAFFVFVIWPRWRDELCDALMSEIRVVVEHDGLTWLDLDLTDARYIARLHGGSVEFPRPTAPAGEQVTP